MKTVTKEDIEEKVEELCDLISRFKGDKPGQACYACFEIVNWISQSYYEALGILSECMMEYKRAYDAIEEEETQEIEQAEKIREALREQEEKTKLQ